MSGSNVSTDLRQGIDSARAGHRLLARLHLAQAIDADPKNDAHWLWMAWVAESPAAAVDHLQKALEHNPGNEIARAGLVWSQTMAEWDFARPLSPRDTLAAVAEREAAAAPAAPSFPIRMPRVDELHGPSSLGYDAPAKSGDFETLLPGSSHGAESAHEAGSAHEAVHEFDLGSERNAAVSEPEIAIEPEQHYAEESVGEISLDAAPEPASEFTSPRIEERKPKTDPSRPESIPIDQLTGMFMGEGQQLLGDEFAGFDMAPGTVDAVQDPTASLATPFPGGLTVGRLSDRRPPSAELATPFSRHTDSTADVDSAGGSESDFDTIPPQTGMPESEHAQDSHSAFAEEPSHAESGHDVEEVQADAAAARKVLIVDDSPTVCKIVSITLKKRGFDVASAADGVEAMAMIATDQPHLILLDITMPRMDGYQLCKLIKGYPQTKQIPVIMLSGKDGFFDRVRGKLVGCADYITKPFDPEMLTATVERFLPAPTPAAAAT